ncbi:LOW QUALITY PROTEIN: C3a anaphylatoxin chemotactic receptor-like [Hypomesus transpacificus]|uniref:LOW QUALITY PROTEIN: C3a anaphylatoxin chemotactic receptor-like n=1 Tax=Hypomesus transpacificus TaxID=137520 RepID=UPI001F07DC62|nr:LOW QUALITY PROTEIN: C3a anaphylatoxin chemotactic receptor-like [Hypomesus transpacificus]
MTTEMPYVNESTTWDYDYSEDPPVSPPVQGCSEVGCVTLVLVYVLIFVLGVCGNTTVIWIAGFKMKKTVNTICYLSLAISDLLFCSCLPFNIVNIVHKKWIFGLFMCKFASFVMFVNMYSSIFLLVIISVDRCVSVAFPVWGQNNRTLKRVMIAVFLAWVISIIISVPGLIVRDVIIAPIEQVLICVIRYDLLSNSHTAIVVNRLVFGFVLPIVIISLCYSVIIIKLQTNRMARSSKPFKVMTALIATFFISWLPYHVFTLTEIKFKLQIVQQGLSASVALASLNSCLNPFLYAFMGRDFKDKCWNFLSRIENAFDDEGKSGTSKRTSSSQVYSKHSTNV